MGFCTKEDALYCSYEVMYRVGIKYSLFDHFDIQELKK